MADFARVVPARELGFPSDHNAIITRFKFREPRRLRMRRYTRKPVGWRPEGDGTDYRMLTAELFGSQREI